MDAVSTEAPPARLGSGRRLARLRHVRVISPVLSTGYCAAQLLILHEFSVYKLSGALIFGIGVPVVVRRATEWLERPASP